MAIITANKDGTSNAKPGDIVITGGGIYEKLSDGTSRKVEDLSDYIGTKTTRDYGVLETIKNSFIAKQGVATTAQNAVNNMAEVTVPGITGSDEYINATVDANGIVTNIQGYNPEHYDAYNTSEETSTSTIIGGVVLAIIGLAILDRLIN